MGLFFSQLKDKQLQKHMAHILQYFRETIIQSIFHSIYNLTENKNLHCSHTKPASIRLFSGTTTLFILPFLIEEKLQTIQRS